MEYIRPLQPHRRFRCTKCVCKPPRTTANLALDLGRGTLTIDSSITISWLAFRSIYNVYNILAACRLPGMRRGGGHRRRGHQQLHPEERTDAEIHLGSTGDAADQQA